MLVEPIGLFTILVGFLCVAFGPGFSVFALVISTLLGAAAAFILPAMGGANIQPAHLLLGFLLFDLILRRGYFDVAIRSVIFPRPGFWLLATVSYGVITAIFMPRIFSGLTNVFAIARSGSVGVIALVPLAPVSGNVTQSIYFASDLVCFVIFWAYCSRREGMRWFCNAWLACAATNIAFGLLDFISYRVGAPELLSPIRNATYSMLIEAEMAGFKRIVGSFTEASSFGTITLCLFAFCGKLWLRGIKPWLSGSLAALSIVALVSSTSTTGYAGFAVYVTIEYILGIAHIAIGRSSKTNLAFVALAPLVALVLATGMALHEPTWATLQEIVDNAFTRKLSSESGVERGAWNKQAILNVTETFGLGVGVGSTRASSWILAVPTSLGIFGALTYFGFALTVLLKPLRGDDFSIGVQSAARSACFAQLLASAIGGAFVDLGLPFFIWAAACLAPLRSEAPATQPNSVRQAGPRAAAASLRSSAT